LSIIFSAADEKLTPIESNRTIAETTIVADANIFFMVNPPLIVY
jgi:hypothetical protein